MSTLPWLSWQYICQAANHSWLLFLCLWCEWYNMGGRRMVIGVCDFCWSLKQSINPSIFSHFCILYRVLVVVNFSWYGWMVRSEDRRKQTLLCTKLSCFMGLFCKLNWLVVNVNMRLRHHYKRIKHASSSSRIFYLLPMISIYRKPK